MRNGKIQTNIIPRVLFMEKNGSAKLNRIQGDSTTIGTFNANNIAVLIRSRS